MKILKFSNSDWVNCTKNNTDRVDNKHLLIEYTISGNFIEYSPLTLTKIIGRK